MGITLDLFVVMFGIAGMGIFGYSIYVLVKFLKERKKYGTASGDIVVPLIILYSITVFISGAALYYSFLGWAVGELLAEVIAIGLTSIFFHVMNCRMYYKAINIYEYEWYVKGSVGVFFITILGNSGIMPVLLT